jgi:hypothetical protein
VRLARTLPVVNGQISRAVSVEDPVAADVRALIAQHLASRARCSTISCPSRPSGACTR